MEGTPSISLLYIAYPPGFITTIVGYTLTFKLVVRLRLEQTAIGHVYPRSDNSRKQFRHCLDGMPVNRFFHLANVYNKSFTIILLNGCDRFRFTVYVLLYKKDLINR